MATKWKAPKGFVVTKLPGYHMNAKGFQAAKGDPLMFDGQIGVAWFDESEPFVEDGEGFSPNVQILPIVDGWVPPVFTLHTEKEAPK